MQALARQEYALHGYRLRVPAGLDLPAPRSHEPDVDGAAGPAGLLDVEVGGVREIPPVPPAGDLVGELSDGDQPLYSFARTDDALTLRFHAYAEVVADPALRQAVAYVHPGVPESVLAVILPGTVLAVRLMLDGRLVLHASAVERDGAAYAVAGPSGSGKSTLAALGVLAGLRLVTDDVLRVDLSDAAAHVWPGAAAVRLRPDVAHLASLARPGPPVPAARTTADGRVGLPAPDVVAGAVPLRHVVVPALSRHVKVPTVRRLDPVSAARHLLLAPRVLGWRGPQELRGQFERTIDLCERVPVSALEVPQRRKGDPDLVPEVLDLLG